MEGYPGLVRFSLVFLFSFCLFVDQAFTWWEWQKINFFFYLSRMRFMSWMWELKRDDD